MILAIESSCDETAVAIYDKDKNLFLSSLISSQINIHNKFGGVIPDIASSLHLECISKLVNDAIKKTKITLKDLSFIAATVGPGLPGALLVGASYAKIIAWSLNIPFIGINHLEGHIYSSGIENNLLFPHLCLSVSGGHTSIYYVENMESYKECLTTSDDAAGELFDKISKLIGLSYPGGPIIEKLAIINNFKNVRNYPILRKKDLYLSFSGLKTAVLYDLIALGFYDIKKKKLTSPIPYSLQKDIASSLLHSVSESLLSRVDLLINKNNNIKGISFVGGVACNNFLKRNLISLAANYNISCWIPSKIYCTDNAAMIAYIAKFRIKNSSYKTDIKI